MPNFFSTQRSDERRRQRVAQCFAHQQWDELRTLLERHPELASSGRETTTTTTTTGGTTTSAAVSTWTLLHSLVYHPGTPNDLIAYVAALDGGMACRVQNSTAETPLHLACDRARPDWDRIRLLLRATCPTTTTTTTGRHTVRRQQQRHRRRQHVADEDDEMEEHALLKRDGFGRTSFFLACANDAPFDILDDFVRRNRFVVTVRDLFAEHPLECLACRLFGNHGSGDDDDAAALQQTTARLVQKLTLVAVEAWKLRPTCPRQAITNDNSREYLLLAILHVKPSLLDVILRVCCSSSRGNGGSHDSTTSDPTCTPTSKSGGVPTPPTTTSISAMTTAGDAVAAGVWRRDAHGNLPLHVALRQPATPLHALPRLLQLAPSTAQVPTGDDGQLPLHLAVQRQQQYQQATGARGSTMARTCPVPLLLPFLHAHPEALSHVVARTGLLPYQDAAARDDDVAVIYTLLRSQPDLLPRRRRYYSAPSSPPPLSPNVSVSSSSHRKYDKKDDSADSGYPCWI